MSAEKQVFTLVPQRPPFETLLYTLAFILWPIFALALGTQGGPMSTLFFLLSFLAAGALVWRRHVPSTVKMGADGFAVRRSGAERFVPWADFEEFVSTPRGIVARTKAGNIPMGRRIIGGVGEEASVIYSQHRTLDVLDAAEARWRKEYEKPQLLELLENEPEVEWRAIIERATRGDYRTSGITEAHLAEALLHPQTPPALRELLIDTVQVRVDGHEARDAIEVLASGRSEKALKSIL